MYYYQYWFNWIRSQNTCENISKKKTKNVDTVVNSIQNLPLPITKAVSNNKTIKEHNLIVLQLVKLATR